MGTPEESCSPSLMKEPIPASRPSIQPPTNRLSRPYVKKPRQRYYPPPFVPWPSLQPNGVPPPSPRPILKAGSPPNSSGGSPISNTCTPSLMMSMLPSCFTSSNGPQSTCPQLRIPQFSSSQGPFAVFNQMGRRATKRGNPDLSPSTSSRINMDDERDIHYLKKQREDTDRGVHFSGIDSVYEEGSEDSEVSSGLEDEKVDKSLPVFPYEAEAASIWNRILSQKFDVLKELHLYQLVVYLAKAYEALEKQELYHLHQDCPSAGAEPVEKLMQCCWREKEVVVILRNLDKKDLQAEFRRVTNDTLLCIHLTDHKIILQKYVIDAEN